MQINRLSIFLMLMWLGVFSCRPLRPSVSSNEQYRPQFHFTPPSKWMNDPNGMVFFEGEYHLFYQYYPDATVWGPMHWGHAVSKDLVEWEHLPIALFPDSLGYIFSGSAVVDWKNTSGFGKNGKPPLVAIYTYHDMEIEKAQRPNTQSQAIAYSTDNGRTWTKYAKNPVIPNPGTVKDFRDPKVIWHEPTQQWIMVLAVADHVEFWGAPDLKRWTYLSSFGKEYGSHGGVWECPDLFPMVVSGSKEEKWVLILNITPGHPNGGSGTQYFVGTFNGTSFTLDPAFKSDVESGRAVWLDWGRDHYAAVTWSDIPKMDGRRIAIGWMSNWDYATKVPTKSWRSGATLPRLLELKKTKKSYHMTAFPVKELEKLRGQKSVMEPGSVPSGTLFAEVKPGQPLCYELELEVDLSKTTANQFSIRLSNPKGEQYDIGYDIPLKRFFSDRRHSGDLSFSEAFAKDVHIAPRHQSNNLLTIRLYLDVASAELFADHGETCITDLFFPSEGFTQIRLNAVDGTVWIKSGVVNQLKRIY